MSDAPSPNVITIDGHAIEYRLERRGDATALIARRVHVRTVPVRRRNFLDAGCSVLVTSRPGYGRTAVSAGPSAPEFAIRLAGLCSLLSLSNLTVVGISLGCPIGGDAGCVLPVSFDHAEYLAETLHDSTLVEVDTPTHLLWLGDGSDHTATAIQSFIRL